MGYAKKTRKFLKEEIPNSKSMYNWINSGLIAIKRADLPEAIARKKRKTKSVEEKRTLFLGESIESRPEAVQDRLEFGHWEKARTAFSSSHNDRA